MQAGRTFALAFLAAGLIATAGCGPSQRHPMVQREIDQCVAGFAKLMPDEAKRKAACECVSDEMQADQKFAGVRDDAYLDAHSERIRECGIAAIPGASKDDPFGILGDDDTTKPSLDEDPSTRDASPAAPIEAEPMPIEEAEKSEQAL